jgi:hypothetical protein
MLITETAPRGACGASNGKEYFVEGEIFFGVFATGAGMKNTVGVTGRMAKTVKKNNEKVKVELAPRGEEQDGAEDQGTLDKDEPAAVEMPEGKAGKKGKADEGGNSPKEEHHPGGLFGETQAVTDMEGDYIGQHPQKKIGAQGPCPAPEPVAPEGFFL